MVAFLKAHKYTQVLVVALFAEVLQPLAKGFVGTLLIDSLVSLLMLGVFLAVFEERAQRVIGLLLALPALATNWLHYLLPERPLLVSELVHHCFLCAFFLFAAVSILRTIFRRREVQADAVVGALCGYLLAGAAFGNLYTVIDLVQPGAFRFNTGLGAELTNWHSRRFLFGYFSLVTLTSLGYGDITPLAPAAASLAWMEAVFGQFYLAVVVAQLVGMRFAPRASQPPPPPQKGS